MELHTSVQVRGDFAELFEDGFEIFDDILREDVGIALKLGLVEPHGLTPVAPLHALRRAKPSEAYPPSLKLRRIPSFIPAFTGGAFSARPRVSRRRVKVECPFFSLLKPG